MLSSQRSLQVADAAQRAGFRGIDQGVRHGDEAVGQRRQYITGREGRFVTVRRTLHMVGAVLGPLMLLASTLSSQSRPVPAPPARLAASGLYSDFAARTVAPANQMYSPQYPLWSDGAGKKRWIYLPPARTIDASRVDEWVFPVGTKLWKEFSFGRTVETRNITKVATGVWTYASYAWNEDETDAVLVPARGLPNHYEIAPGVRHDIPGVDDCKACHEGQGRDVVLGFKALQLSPDRDSMAPNTEPFAPGMIDLTSLIGRRRLANMPARFTDTPPRIAATSPRARAALGYLDANCGGCHNAADSLSSVGLVLKHALDATPGEAQLALQTAVGQRSQFEIPGLSAEQSYRILPGDPSKSSVVYRMGSRNPYQQMPPLGTKMVDQQALALVSLWIREDLAGTAGPVK
jgi:hypothetical protein